MQTATPTTPIVAREGLSANVGSLWPGRRTGITHGHATARQQTDFGDPDGSLISPRISEGHRRPQEGRSLAIGLPGVIGSGLTRHYMTGAHDRAARRVRTGAKSQAPIRSMAAVPSISLPA
jgi:hypothetical protein